MKQNQKGFTIIEVVLVLAIAGLIFLIVFLALPQLQRSRRDTQRKSDAGRVLSALESFAGNNGGSYPGSQAALTSFQSTYLSSNFSDPQYGSYTLTYQTTAPTNTSDGKVTYHNAATCGSNGALSTATSANKIAVSVQLESGYYCQGN